MSDLKGHHCETDKPQLCQGEWASCRMPIGGVGHQSVYPHHDVTGKFHWRHCNVSRKPQPRGVMMSGGRATARAIYMYLVCPKGALIRYCYNIQNITSALSGCSYYNNILWVTGVWHIYCEKTHCKKTMDLVTL